MSGIADSADARIILDLEYALNNMQRFTVVEPDMHCLFCDGPIGYGELFCNVECRNDYQKLQAAIKRNGGNISY
ncbi:DUF2116 family Zn-ribbon domain-containing protein [Undibacterium sp. JH2W]|uniref:DUF2116 family Zn-ribbon domain-containing protein n=1 Tax=Undibacterium sp. JH2W TaxID=3413037 RepID=UPI003BF0F49B